MRKFFVKEEQVNDKVIEITGDDVNHIRNVLRLECGEKIVLCDMDNSINYLSEISKIEKDKILCIIQNQTENQAEGNVQITIFQGLPKADKMELIIQKGTELGVKEFIPVNFERCIVKLKGKDEEKKIDRWQKIAEMAAKQSGRDIVPKITSIESIKNICNLISNYDIVLIAYENEKENSQLAPSLFIHCIGQ